MIKHKICICEEKNAFFLDGIIYRCQYCEGMLKPDRVKKIVDYNMPIKEPERESAIAKEVARHCKEFYKAQDIHDQAWGLKGYQS